MAEVVDGALWDDCNRCRRAAEVNPGTNVCENCGCTTPGAEYSDQELLRNLNPNAWVDGLVVASKIKDEAG